MKTRKELFGARIKELRKNEGVSQERLSEQIGIESKYLSRIEVGKSYPSLETVEKIADALQVEIKELFNFSHLEAGATQVQTIENLLTGLDEGKLRLVFKVINSIVH
jgi:transcriptional regulator with XRE-family HTH domain